MNLTICLLTKGRERYINQALASFEPFLQDPDVRILLIDNGSEFSIKERLQEWQSKSPQSISLVRFDVNESRPSSLWPTIFNAGIDWVWMPGDDDQLKPDILAEWRAAVYENPNLVAFALSAAVMNEDSSLTGEVLFPQAGFSNSKIEQVVMALHRTPFIWPSLLFRVSKVNPIVPSSRYAFDWWVSINLLMAGDIKTTKSIGVNYRVYSKQESGLAPSRRKHFEGLLCLDDFIKSDVFDHWMHGLDDHERILLWRGMSQREPINGDLTFARPLIFSIARMLMDTALSSSTASQIAGELASENGVFLKKGESVHLIRNSRDSIIGEHPANIRVTLSVGTCNEVVAASRLLNGPETGQHFKISCKHSRGKTASVIVDCKSLLPGEHAMNADLIINAITSFCEERNDFELLLSSEERAGLLLWRSLKNRLPNKLKAYLRKVEHFKAR